MAEARKRLMLLCRVDGSCFSFNDQISILYDKVSMCWNFMRKNHWEKFLPSFTCSIYDLLGYDSYKSITHTQVVFTKFIDWLQQTSLCNMRCIGQNYKSVAQQKAKIKVIYK